MAGLTVNPASVTVGDDGKLNAAIKIKYTTEATVDAASTAISLTIGELTQTVKVGYSAIQAKQYISSINIEQLVLDNGKSYNINAALTAAHIDFANINDLDSLNDDKTKRNEPYLGLKIKAADAYVAGWLKANDTLSVKFGNVGDAIKVVGIQDDDETYYPNGLGNEYVVDAAHAGETIVYFRPAGNAEWAAFGGYFFIPDNGQGIEAVNIDTKATKLIRNGQLFIRKNGKIYNVIGQQIAR